MENGIWQAIGKADLVTLEDIIVSQPTLANQRSPRGMTPLILTVQAGNVEVVNSVLRLGADPNRATDLTSNISGRVDLGVLPIMFAHSRQVLRMLVNAGAELDACDGGGRSIFLRIASLFDVELLDELLQCGFEPSLHDLERVKELATDELKYRQSLSGAGQSERIQALRSVSVWCEARSNLRHPPNQKP